LALKKTERGGSDENRGLMTLCVEEERGGVGQKWQPVERWEKKQKLAWNNQIS